MLRKQHCEPPDVHIIMEATGVYHESLAYGLHGAGVRVSLANPHRAREFARGMGIFYMLACYGVLKEPEPWEPPPENVRYLRRASVPTRVLRYLGQRAGEVV